MAATHRLSCIGFVPPYFFDHLAKADPQNAQAWQKCQIQAQQAFEKRAQEARRRVTALYEDSLVPLSSGKLPSVRAISLQSPSPTRSAPFSAGPVPTTKVSVRTPPDQDAINAEKNGGIVIKFLSEVFNRSSFDGKGSELTIYVHSKEAPNNAFWTKDAVYIGDTTLPQRSTLTADVDVTAHEVGHGVNEYTAKLFYEDQSGALNESWADIFGSMVKQYSLDQTTSQADWLIGDKYVDDLPGRVQALRSMKSPGEAYWFSDTEKDPQIDHIDKLGTVDSSLLRQDHGGVHIYSGIPNKAFYQFAMGFPQYHSWEIAGKVWYQTLLSSIDQKATFQQFAEATVKAVKKVSDFPTAVSVNDIVTRLEESWEKVGIQLKKAPKPTPPSTETKITIDHAEFQKFLLAPKPARASVFLDDRQEPSHRPRRTRKRQDSCDCVLL